MKEITALTDYKDFFGLKHYASPYRSGYDKELLRSYFASGGYQLNFLRFADVDFKNQNYKDKIFIYTSSEDKNYFYKSFIEDIIFGLEINNALIIPKFKYLRSNNNKVFMEILRDSLNSMSLSSLSASYYGTKEEFYKANLKIKEPLVIKTAEGSSGRGVFLSKDLKSTSKYIRFVSRTEDLVFEFWDFGRSLKHKGYTRESRFRKKFIVQEFIKGLANDWKVYIYGKRVYVFYRPIFRKRGIRASGGGYENYYYGAEAKIPEGLLNFANEIFKVLRVPNVSLDIGYDGEKFYLFEFQCLYFGTAGILFSNEFFIKRADHWEAIKEKLDQEKVYSDSIIEYLEKPDFDNLK